MFSLPVELDGKEPLNDIYSPKINRVRAWWSYVNQSVRAPIKHLTITSALDAKQYALFDPMWANRLALGCKLYGTEGGYASCETIELPGGSGVFFTSRNKYRNESNFGIKTSGSGGIINISLSGTEDDHTRLSKIMNDLIKSIKLKN